MKRKPRADDARSDARRRLERADVAARHGWIAGWWSILLVAFVYVVFADRVPMHALGWWAAATLATIVPRVGASALWRRIRGARDAVRATPVDDDVVRWERANAAIALAGGIAWAGLAVVAPLETDVNVLPASLASALALALATTSYVASRPAFLAHAMPLVLVVFVQLVRFVPGPVLPLAWLVLCAGLFQAWRVTHRGLVDALADRFARERRAAEQQAIFETAPLGMLVARDLRIVVVNRAMLRMLGYQREQEIVGRSIRALIPDEAAWREALDTSRAAMRGSISSRIVRRRRADGTVVELKLDLAAVDAGQGDVEFVGIYEDIHERIAAEQGYRDAVRLQQLVFESAGEGIAIVNRGVIEQANQALGDLMGVPAHALESRPFASLFEDREAWADIEWRFDVLRGAMKLERRIVRADGRTTWVNVSGRPVAATSTPYEAASATPAMRSVWILADLTAQKQREADTWHQANHDVLTGLPNRRFVQDRLEQALALARRDGRCVAVLAVDLDGFKTINDTLGHRFGDGVLEEIGRRLPSTVRELDTVGRWGGDEFVLVFNEVESRDAVEEMVKRVLATVARPIEVLGQSLAVAASIGIALYPDHGDESEAIVLAADLAMYEAKGAGGGAWRFATVATSTPRGKYRPSSQQRRA